MDHLTQLRSKVAELYQAQDPNRDDWCDWLYEHHVLVVAQYARELAKKYDANEGLSEAAALLHDIADAKMARVSPNHEASSLEIARQLMTDCGYAEEEITLVIDDAVKYHSCHDDERPQSKEGLVLATADSLAHLKTDFYIYGAWAFGKDRSLEQLKEWVIKKIDRDLYAKIFFEDERADAQLYYDALKLLFSL